ncbi:MAG: HTTM domain-containing protein, partial [Myxococcota bacterium]
AFARLWVLANEPRDAASLAAFRVFFGLLGFFGALRFLVYGWIDQFFGEPSFFFSYWGLEFVPVLPPSQLKVVFVVLAALSMLVALGLFYRVAIVLWLVVFSYVEALDVTNYLNHYYLLSVLGFWMCFMPLGRTYGLDGKFFGARTTLPTWMITALRFQVGCVYFYAGIAKLTGDWLLHAQPLAIWLHARTDTPFVGSFFDQTWVAYAMSWGGFFFDTTIAGWLLWGRTRRYAYAVLVGFHVAVGYLFPIGLFPWIMIASATVFFPASWPRFGRAKKEDDARPVRTSRVLIAGLTVFALFQFLMPLRTFAYGGNVLWHEQGMRWSWRVLCREKNGSVSYRVQVDGRRREFQVPPSRYLTAQQEREMSSQPDLILQLAHHIAGDFRRRGYEGVEVRVDALVSLNGRRPARMIDPDADLARIEDGIGRADWILPAPTDSPPHFANKE